jgi:hypothetical protein
MKNISTGFGLCVLGLGIAAWPVLDRLAPSANASAVTAAASAVSTAATAQTGPTIVWYGMVQTPHFYAAGGYHIASTYTLLGRAWSDGRLEVKKVCTSKECNEPIYSPYEWVVVSDPAQGLTYRSDINFDAKVDGADLGQLLADWGDAPRQAIPPSDCPLALINP